MTPVLPNCIVCGCLQTIQPPFDVMSEEPGGVGCPNFVTGAGGVLSAVWAGWGGVRLRDDRLDLVYPIPPPGATSMRLARLHCEYCNLAAR